MIVTSPFPIGNGKLTRVRPHYFFCAHGGGNIYMRLHLLVLELWLVYLSWLLLNTQDNE